MKIAFLAYGLDRNPRGIGQYSQRLLRAYQELGFNPLVLQASGGLGGNPSIKLAGAGLLPALMTLGQLEIGWIARHYQLELIHDPTGTAPLIFCPTLKVVTIHDVFPLSFPGHSAALENLIYRLWLPHAVRHMEAVITVSQKSRDDIQTFLPITGEKICVIAEAAGKHFRLLSKAEICLALERHKLARPFILYVGSLEPRKNLLRLLEAYKRLLDWSLQWRLVIVGARNAWKSSPVAAKVAELGLQERVTFTGYVPDEDLPALYNAADLFCFPSLYEGFGLPVLEAMACGTPVVTSNTSSLPEVAGQAALLVDPTDVEAIAAAMQRVLEDPELARELRQRGIARAAEFSWEKTARETIAVYKKVLGNKLIK